mgnify:CR=1 FL=1
MQHHYQSLQEIDRIRDHALLHLEQAREQGSKIVGIYCIFAPGELIRAAGCIPVGLCGKKEDPIPEAETVLPANLCPLIKSSYGYAATDTCPYFAQADMVLGESTCDGKIKMFELLNEIKHCRILHLPPTSRTDSGLRYWYREILKLKDFLEDWTGQRISHTAVRREISRSNRIGRTLWEIGGTCQWDHPPLSGSEMMRIFEANSSTPYPESLRYYADRLLQEVASRRRSTNGTASRPRILLTGSPVGSGSDKVLQLLEQLGAQAVALENCTGLKSLYRNIREDCSDPLHALAERYLQTPCPCMTPNANRFNFIRDLVRQFRIQGVVDLSWQSCQPYSVESSTLSRMIRERLNLSYLHLETDYSNSDTEQLRTRLQAFLELIEDNA